MLKENFIDKLKLLPESAKQFIGLIIVTLIVVYTDKTTYEGEWVDTKKHGKGVETWPNGYIYTGEFKNSLWSGQGILTFPDGSTYDGEWANGFMNGQGTFTWADGKQKTGIWKNGKLQE